MNCNELIKIAAVSFVVCLLVSYIKDNKENFRYTTLQGANNIVLTDEQGNLSSIQFPKGMVMIWTGDLTQIPQGWALCDGTNGTPDLRGRFVLGVNSKLTPVANLSPTNMRDNGGEEAHTLTIDEMPKHTHKYTFPRASVNTSHDAFAAGNNDVFHDRNVDTFPEGGNKPHNNMPPYLVLAYIMKL
jgi:microcystin-dependent protein